MPETFCLLPVWLILRQSPLPPGIFHIMTDLSPGSPQASQVTRISPEHPYAVVISRAFLAASLALAESTIFCDINSASDGFSSRNSLSFSLTSDSTIPFTSDETSLSFVCEENFGSGTFTESTAIKPSRASSPDTTDFCLFCNTC